MQDIPLKTDLYTLYPNPGIHTLSPEKVSHTPADFLWKVSSQEAVLIKSQTTFIGSRRPKSSKPMHPPLSEKNGHLRSSGIGAMGIHLSIGELEICCSAGAQQGLWTGSSLDDTQFKKPGLIYTYLRDKCVYFAFD